MTRFRFAFVALAVVWALMLPAAPFAASRSLSTSSSASSTLALVVYRIGRLICHQRPERSFHLFGAQLPVCARCTGIYAGAALTAVVAWWSTLPARRQTNLGDPTGVAARRVLLTATAPIAATLIYEWMTGKTPGHWTRAASGVPLGVAVAWIVWWRTAGNHAG